MHWTFKNVEKLQKEAKERILDFYVFYMQQRGWKFDWKVWKEIDVGTELEEYNKKLEAPPPAENVIMSDIAQDPPTSDPVL